MIFALIFWAGLAATLTAYLMDPDRYSEAALFPAVAIVVVVWMLLPWDPQAGRRRLLMVPAFLAISFVMGYLTGLTWSGALYSLALANAVLLFGLWRGLAYVAVLLPIIFVNYLLVQPAWSFEQILKVTAWWIPSFAFVIGVCATILQAIEQRQHAEVLLAKLESAHAELQRSAARVRELAISEERARMAREIHDTVGHYLTVVNVQLEAAGKLMDRNPEKAREEVDRAKMLASEALSEVRRSVRALKPLSVEERVGTGALAALVRGFEGTGTAVSFAVEGEKYALPPDAELVLYRALQEGLTNALRHSGARRVSATLAFEPSLVRLTVADDGKGAAEGAMERGFGLSGLEERTAALGGTLSAGNAAGGGFVLEVELPVGTP